MTQILTDIEQPEPSIEGLAKRGKPKKPKETIIPVRFTPKLHPETGPSPLFDPCRYKVFYGGRGGSKSHNIAQALLLLGTQKKLRILCAREFQSSIQNSVWQLLCDKVEAMHLTDFYRIEKSMIYGQNGTQISFQGIRQNISSIKSFEGTDICWCEESSNISNHSWEILLPTIRRKEGSEVWISFNPEWEQDSTYQRWVVNPPAGTTVVKVNWEDNPFLGDDLKLEIEELRASDPDSYRHIYGGECRQYLDGAVYKNEIREAQDDGRICEVKYEPQCGVETFWDIGISDATAIIVGQRVGREFHIIDYLEDTGKPLGWYLMLLNDKSRFPFPIDRFWLPHDADTREKGTGLTYAEIIRQRGYRVSIVPNLGKGAVDQGINATRTVFPLMWFDRFKCEKLLNALRNYVYEYRGDPTKNDYVNFKNQPRHDRHSHAADALRYCALALRPPKEKAAPKYGNEAWRLFGQQKSTSWMNL